MRPEYVRIVATENIYGKKNLLQSQLDLISVIKHLENYKNLRSQELMLKIALKNKIEEIHNLIQLLQKLLPKPILSPEKSPLPLLETKRSKKRKLSLEQEIEDIRKKLAALS